MATVTKKEIIERIADLEGCKRSVARRLIQSFLDTIVEELCHGHRLEFRDFGVFESKIRAAREAQNPKTMEKIPVPPRRTVKFKVGRVMRRRLDESPVVVDDATGLVIGASVRSGPPSKDRQIKS